MDFSFIIVIKSKRASKLLRIFWRSREMGGRKTAVERRAKERRRPRFPSVRSSDENGDWERHKTTQPGAHMEGQGRIKDTMRHTKRTHKTTDLKGSAAATVETVRGPRGSSDAAAVVHWCGGAVVQLCSCALSRRPRQHSRVSSPRKSNKNKRGAPPAEVKARRFLPARRK